MNYWHANFLWTSIFRNKCCSRFYSRRWANMLFRDYMGFREVISWCNRSGNAPRANLECRTNGGGKLFQRKQFVVVSICCGFARKTQTPWNVLYSARVNWNESKWWYKLSVCQNKSGLRPHFVRLQYSTVGERTDIIGRSKNMFTHVIRCRNREF